MVSKGRVDRLQQQTDSTWYFPFGRKFDWMRNGFHELSTNLEDTNRRHISVSSQLSAGSKQPKMSPLSSPSKRYYRFHTIILFLLFTSFILLCIIRYVYGGNDLLVKQTAAPLYIEYEVEPYLRVVSI